MKTIAAIAASMLAATAYADVIAFQNFNSLDDSGTFNADSFAVSSAGQALTNTGAYNSGGGGLDFVTYWSDTRGNMGPRATDIGSDTSDFIGVNSFAGTRAPDVSPTGVSVSSGTEHNFEFNDGDGRLDLVFETVDTSGYDDRTISFSLWLADTGYEDQDSVQVLVTDGSTSSVLVSVVGDDLELITSADDGTANWLDFTFDLETLGLGDNISIAVSVDNNASAENIYLDDLIIEGTPE